MKFKTRFANGKRFSGISLLRREVVSLRSDLIKVMLTGLLCFASLNVKAQGTVHFAGNNSTRIINGLTGLPVTAADGVKAALYWSPLGSNKFVQIGTAVDVGVALPGVFIGGTRSAGPETPGGGRAQFQVRAWESAYGATYEEALSAYQRGPLLGQSEIIEMPTGNATGIPPTPPAVLTSYGLQEFRVKSAGSPPSIGCPPNLVTNHAVVFFDTPPATGVPGPAVLCIPPSGSTLPVGTNRITCSASNRIGTSQCAFQVIIHRPELLVRAVYPELGCRFLILGEANHQYLTECSTNLLNWFPLQTNLLQGPALEIVDTDATNSRTRFYRVRPWP